MRFKIENILPLVSSHEQGCHLNDICSELQINSREYHLVEGLLKQLCELGLVTEIECLKFRKQDDLVQGTLSMHAQGFAFVYPELNDESNLYIDRNDLLGALHRDRVKVSVYTGPDGRIRGKVVSVVERGTQMCVGIYRQDRSQSSLPSHIHTVGFIYPQDTRLPSQIPVIADSIHAIDQDNPLTDGQWVAAFLQEAHGQMYAQILHRIDPSSAQGELEAVIYDQGITLHLDQDVQEEAQRYSEEITADEINRRKDVRHLPFITIDPETAQDFDDALYAYTREEGGWHLWVAIADVTHYVKADSAIDQAAQKRSATLYLPAQAFPMLPKRLSNHLCSLKPNVERLAMLTYMQISPQGEIENTQFFEGVICSQARFTYNEAASLLGILPAKELPKKLQRMNTQLQALRDCTRALKLRRRKRGFLNLEMVEPRLQFDLRGMVDGFSVYQRHEVHHMVEEAMLAANESVASFCIKNEIPAVYRQHNEPTDRGVSRFLQQAKLLAVPFKNQTKIKAIHLSRYLKQHDKHPLKYLISTLLLRAMARATYEADPGLHFGLGTVTYLHFTSPIRRYPDLWVHRQLKYYLNQQITDTSADAQEVAVYSSRRERLLMQAERNVLSAYRALFMKQFIGEVMKGTVCQTSHKGFRIELHKYPIMCTHDLQILKQNKGFTYDETTFTWRHKSQKKKITLGSQVDVNILHTSVIEGEIIVKLDYL